jgi:hypothetical protein
MKSQIIGQLAKDGWNNQVLSWTQVLHSLHLAGITRCVTSNWCPRAKTRALRSCENLFELVPELRLEMEPALATLDRRPIPPTCVVVLHKEIQEDAKNKVPAGQMSIYTVRGWIPKTLQCVEKHVPASRAAAGQGR